MRKKKSDTSHDEPHEEPHEEPPVEPAVEPSAGYRTLAAGGPPVVGDLRADHPEVFELKLTQAARYSLVAKCSTGTDNVAVEVHPGAYPAPVPIRQVNFIHGPMQPGVFYVTVLPTRPLTQTRFSLICRRTGRL
jgi:hypothetical protein